MAKCCNNTDPVSLGTRAQKQMKFAALHDCETKSDQFFLISMKETVKSSTKLHVLQTDADIKVNLSRHCCRVTV